MRRYTAFSKGVNTNREQLLQKLESLEIEQKRLRADLNFLESYAAKIVNPNMLPFSPNLFVDAGVLYQDRGRELEEALVENRRNLEEVKADLSRFEIESKTRKDYYLLEAQLEVNEKEEVDISMTISYGTFPPSSIILSNSIILNVDKQSFLTFCGDHSMTSM